MNCPVCNRPMVLTGVTDNSVQVICHGGHRSQFDIMPQWMDWAVELSKKAERLGTILSSVMIPAQIRSLVTAEIFELTASAILAARVTPEPSKEAAIEVKPIIAVYTDGSCHPNPGPAGCGAVLKSFVNGTETIIDKVSVPMAEKASNNEAEYAGICEGLKLAYKHKFTQFELHSDSELVLRQIQGSYKVGEKMKPWLERVQALILSVTLEVTWKQISGDDNPAHREAEAAYKMADAAFKLKEGK